MKKSVIVIFGLILCVAFTMSHAQDVLHAVFTGEQAGIVVDGDLSEWESLGLQQIPLSFYQNITTREQITPSPGDLSAWFKCFADRDYLYVAVSVTDDRVIIGNHPFGDGHRDDCVEICFDGDLADITKAYFDSNDGQVRIVPKADGGAYIEGNVPYLAVSIPYYWEARGIRSGFRQNPNGYTVEAAIPLALLEIDKVSPGIAIGLNVRVIDQDASKGESESSVAEKYVSWSVDPDMTSWWKTEFYNRVVFDREIALDSSLKQDEGTITSTGDNSWEIELGLDAPDAKAYNEELAAVLGHISVEEWPAAEEKILPLTDRLWAQLFLGAMQLHSDNYIEGLQRLQDFSSVSPDGFASDWTETFPYDMAKVMMMTPAQRREHAKAAFIAHELLQRNPNDERAVELIGFALRGTGGTPEDLRAINSVISQPVNNTVSDLAQAALARYHFINGQFDNAENICRGLLARETIPQVALEARMILLSIDTD